MTIWFETHATSLDNEAQLASGWFDVALSKVGEQQARELGERCRGRALSAVYCSDLRRSYDTATIAFSAIDLPIARDQRLRECDYGTMTRLPSSEVDAERLARIATPFPGGESYEGCARRVGEWLHEAQARHRGHPGAPILVIGHRATFYALEHFCHRRPLPEVINDAWQRQPGWRYDLH